MILLNEHQAAATLGNLSVKTLQRWRWAGRGPRFIRIGSCIRYSLDELQRFIAANTFRSTTEADVTSPVGAGED